MAISVRNDPESLSKSTSWNRKGTMRLNRCCSATPSSALVSIANDEGCWDFSLWMTLSFLSQDAPEDICVQAQVFLNKDVLMAWMQIYQCESHTLNTQQWTLYGDTCQFKGGIQIIKALSIKWRIQIHKPKPAHSNLLRLNHYFCQISNTGNWVRWKLLFSVYLTDKLSLWPWNAIIIAGL